VLRGTGTTGGIGDDRDQDRSMKLSRFDKVLGLNRERIERVYPATGAPSQGGIQAAPLFGEQTLGWLLEKSSGRFREHAARPDRRQPQPARRRCSGSPPGRPPQATGPGGDGKANDSWLGDRSSQLSSRLSKSSLRVTTGEENVNFSSAGHS
jgi:hypothetical protein